MPIQCSSTQFRCKNSKKCIFSRFTCDGRNDCSDGSDESIDRCGADPCFGKIQCLNNKRCIPTSWCCQSDIECDQWRIGACCQTGILNISEPSHHSFVDIGAERRQVLRNWHFQNRSFGELVLSRDEILRVWNWTPGLIGSVSILIFVLCLMVCCITVTSKWRKKRKCIRRYNISGHCENGVSSTVDENQSIIPLTLNNFIGVLQQRSDYLEDPPPSYTAVVVNDNCYQLPPLMDISPPAYGDVVTKYPDS